MAKLRLCHRAGDQHLQHLQVDVGQALDVETDLAKLVRSQLVQQDVPTFEVVRNVNDQLSAPRGERGQRGIAFVAAVVLVVVAAKPDDARPPHPGFLPGHSAHQGKQSVRILALLLVRNGSNMALDTDFRGFGLGYVHMHLRTASLAYTWEIERGFARIRRISADFFKSCRQLKSGRPAYGSTCAAWR